MIRMRSAHDLVLQLLHERQPVCRGMRSAVAPARVVLDVPVTPDPPSPPERPRLTLLRRPRTEAP
jgi:hypothetical protein